MTNTERRTEFLYRLGELLTFASDMGLPVICSTFYRSPEEQRKMFDNGLSKCDGYIKKSAHQSWLAVDIYVMSGTDISDKEEDYTILGEKWEELGGTWGGRFESLKDFGHFEY